MKRSVLFLLALALLLSCAGCAASEETAQPSQANDPPQTAESETSDAPALEDLTEEAEAAARAAQEPEPEPEPEAEPETEPGCADDAGSGQLELSFGGSYEAPAEPEPQEEGVLPPETAETQESVSGPVAGDNEAPLPENAGTVNK